MHAGLPEARDASAAKLSGSCPYAGINRIRFNGSIRLDVSGETRHPEELLSILTPFDAARACPGGKGQAVRPARRRSSASDS